MPRQHVPQKKSIDVFKGGCRLFCDLIRETFDIQQYPKDDKKLRNGFRIVRLVVGTVLLFPVSVPMLLSHFLSSLQYYSVHGDEAAPLLQNNQVNLSLSGTPSSEFVGSSLFNWDLYKQENSHPDFFAQDMQHIKQVSNGRIRLLSSIKNSQQFDQDFSECSEHLKFSQLKVQNESLLTDPSMHESDKQITNSVKHSSSKK